MHYELRVHDEASSQLGERLDEGSWLDSPVYLTTQKLKSLIDLSGSKPITIMPD